MWVAGETILSLPFCHENQRHAHTTKVRVTRDGELKRLEAIACFERQVTLNAGQTGSFSWRTAPPR